MGSSVPKKEAFDWGIVGVDLDDIDVSAANPNDAAARLERDPWVSAMPSDTEFSDLSLDPIVSSNESTSIFERFPAAMVSDSDDEKAEGPGSYLAGEASKRASFLGQLREPLAVDPDLLPYSWMVQNPGQIAENIGGSAPRTLCTNAQPGTQSPINVDGETHMEEVLKREPPSPYVYFFRAAAFSCLMDLNSHGLIHPNLFAIIIGRIFDADPRILDVFNRLFMPPGFRIQQTTRCAAIHDCLLQVGRHLETHPTHASDPRFKALFKVLHHLVQRRTSDDIHMNEIVGKLVCSSSGREFRPDPGNHTILSGPKLSPHFLSRSGNWWPFKNFPWQEADLLGLCSAPRANRRESTGTIDPRRLVVRGIHRAWA